MIIALAVLVSLGQWLHKPTLWCHGYCLEKQGWLPEEEINRRAIAHHIY
jgi:hypothetical protein